MCTTCVPRTSLKKASGFLSAVFLGVFCILSFLPQRAFADPSIAQLTVGTVTSTTAVITWTTDTPSDSFISYAATGENTVLNVQDDSMITSHRLTLTGLKPETQYAFTVNSADAEGNNASMSGTPFTTLSSSTTIAQLPSLEISNSTPTSTPVSGLQYTPPVIERVSSPYPTGTLVQEGAVIYFLMAKDLVKIPFSTLAAFTGLGYKLRNVQKVDVSGFRVSSGYVISSPTEEHPWGSWLKSSNGTLYYSHSSGLIGVPSMDVFIANGGKSEMIVPLNAADKRVLQLNSHLPVLEAQDERIL